MKIKTFCIILIALLLKLSPCYTMDQNSTQVQNSSSLLQLPKNLLICIFLNAKPKTYNLICKQLRDTMTLTYAIANKDTEHVTWLLASGIKPTTHHLHMVIALNDLLLIDKLLIHGAKPDNAMIYQALQGGNAALVQSLMSYYHSAPEEDMFNQISSLPISIPQRYIVEEDKITILPMHSDSLDL